MNMKRMIEKLIQSIKDWINPSVRLTEAEASLVIACEQALAKEREEGKYP
jgi:hypothetical protein